METNQDSAPRILSDESHTRYIELSSQFDAYWHPSVTMTLAVFTDQGVVLHRLTSEETAVRFGLSEKEIQALLTGYTDYVVARESVGRSPNENPFDPLADVDDHPF